MAAHGQKKSIGIAAMAIACGKTGSQAAQEANVGERTVARWCADHRFNAKVERLRARIDDAAIGRVVSHMTAAIDFIGEVVRDTERPDAIRLKAAQTIIEYRVKVRDQWELKREVADMKAQMDRLEAQNARMMGEGAQPLTASDSVESKQVPPEENQGPGA